MKWGKLGDHRLPQQLKASLSSCDVCGNGWTSMRGMIQFDVQLQPAYNPEGVSLFV